MEFNDLLTRRRSIRKYVSKEIPKESLDRILNAVKLSPSWGNKQCWHIIVVKDQALKKKLGEATGNNPNKSCYEDASALIVLFADKKDSGIHDGKEYYMFDMGLAAQNLIMAAANEGLDTCIIGWFDEKPIKEILGIPDNYTVVALTPLGYGALKPNSRLRKNVNDFTSYDKYDK